MTIESDEYYINLALKEAEKAMANGDIPVGVVIVFDGKVVGKGYNQVEKKNDSLAHAEMIAIKNAIRKVGYKHLLDCTMYVTLEPCSMCAGAIVLARLKKVIYAANDPKTGAMGSLYNIPQDERLNHFVQIESGILENKSSELIKSFFRGLRRKD
ncbi:MAG: tRNA-specific adenosine deaminase [Ignavibacteria bacterium GWF2_33_9]|nr:MAG: tRNA-specific adenosine deaminase [Ignavibacteria bacterium GWF2_33_9]